MDSPQSVVSPFKTSLVAEPEKQSFSPAAQNSDHVSNGPGAKQAEPVSTNFEDPIGVLEVYIHQARDIQNICIYHKQDVYAKLCLTSNPENSVSTKIVNGGGRNPVFDENLRLSVRTVDSSLKCEIFMMSRVKNYLEDQLLGFTLVPISEIILKDGKLESEFTLSSTDLFHSPSGFVHLSLLYAGASPEVMAIPPMSRCISTDQTLKNSEAPESIPSELDRIEFPDPIIVNENQKMVSEYFGMSCSNMDSESSETYVTPEAESQTSLEGGVHVEETAPPKHDYPRSSMAPPKHDSPKSSMGPPKRESPPSSVSTNGVSSPSSDSEASKAPSQEQTSFSAPKEKPEEANVNPSGAKAHETSMKPLLTVNVEPEHKMVQQEFVDMYMKSMQQFTESLAKMKLPLDTDSPTRSDTPTSDQKMQTPKSTGSRVFYGSRAFF